MREHYATLHLDSWAGRSTHPVLVVGETPKRYRVRLLETVARWPGRNRRALIGEVKLVPKSSVQFNVMALGEHR